MTIKVGSPQFRIIAFKTTGVDFGTGNQYRGASGSIDGIDLTPFLGDAGTIHTNKAVDDPCGGFSITFADRYSTVGGDTVYRLLEAMDMIEVRAARLPVGTNGQLPLIMRGYITSIRRVRSISGDGTPSRVVVVQGQDSGKLWQNHSILPEAQLSSDLNSMLSAFMLNAATGINLGVVPVEEFVRTFIEKVMNSAVGKMSAFSGREVPSFKAVTSVQNQGRVSAAMLQGFGGGRYWDVLEYVADRPWNELFVRDQEDGPEVIFRPVPYRDLGGALIMPGAQDPGTFSIDIGEIVKMDSVRSDLRTANFFYVSPSSSQPDTAVMSSVAAFQRVGTGPMFATDHPNSALALYGLRKMEHGTRLMPSEGQALPANAHPPDQRLQAGDTTTEWHIQRAQQLNLLNRDNSVWETVEMTAKGCEDFKAGMEVQWTEGQERGAGLVSRGYCARVQQIIAPLRSGGSAAWTTQLSIERGDGFLNADEMQASPFWAEGRRGPMSPNS